LHYLDEIAENDPMPNLTKLCQALGIPKAQRQHAYQGLEFLAATHLVDKIKVTATKNVTYRISAQGRELVKKLSERILLGETRLAG
jgi:DNA-binding PadR family transcriptional regulator